jgi:hypothetical protein
MMMQAMKRENIIEKLTGLTNVCLIIVSLAIVITDPANASPARKSPFMNPEIDQVADSSLSSSTEDHHRTISGILIESTSAVPFVIDNTIPTVRAPWLPVGRELLILEVPLSEPSSSNRETDSTGALLNYDE